jgi:hypothetical protein
MLSRRLLVTSTVACLLLNVFAAAPTTADDKAPPGDGNNKNEVVVIDNDNRIINIFEAAGGRIGVTINGGQKILLPIVPPFNEQRQPQAVVAANGDVLIFYIGKSTSPPVITVGLVARIKKGQNTIADARAIVQANTGSELANIGAAVDTFPASPFFNTVYVAGQFNPVGMPVGEIGLLFSRDAGETWLPTNFTVVNNQKVNSTPVPGVGANGQVYVAYVDFTGSGPTRQLFADVSNDGGKTFAHGPVSSIIPGPQFPYQRPSICPYDQNKISILGTDCSTGVCQIGQWWSLGGGMWGPVSYPFSSHKDQGFHRRFCIGQLMAVIFEQAVGIRPLSNITFSQTTDGGHTWSQPIQVNEQARDLTGVINASTSTYPNGASPQPVDVVLQKGTTTTPLGAARSRGLVTGTQAFPVWTVLTAVGHTEVFTAGTPPGNSLVAAVLPGSRSVQVGVAATAFVTVINTGTTAATAVGITLLTDVPVTFSYQTTNAANVPIGTPNTPVDIPPNSIQTFVIALTPTAAFPPSDILLGFAGTNTLALHTIVGLNTLLATGSTTPVPDIVALVATPNRNGIIDLVGATGAAAFAVATVNVGAGGTITMSASTSDASLPLTITVCQTDPVAGFCLSPPTSSVQANIGPNQTPTFGVFVVGNGIVPFDPGKNRITVIFTDAQGVIRGSTNVAVRTL